MRQFLLLAFLPLAAFGQPAGWNDAFPPHKVMDNLYYVGTKELASFLIVTPAGNILMNSDYEASVPVIRASVEKLGFKFSDIKILIAGHAHPDHVEGDALVKELTGAQVVVGRVDAPATKAFRPGGKEHPIDRLVDDGDTVTLGGTTWNKGKRHPTLGNGVVAGAGIGQHRPGRDKAGLDQRSERRRDDAEPVTALAVLAQRGDVVHECLGPERCLLQRLLQQPILLEDSIDGKNRLVPGDQFRGQLQPLFGAYRDAPANLSVRTGPSEIAEWLARHL